MPRKHTACPQGHHSLQPLCTVALAATTLLATLPAIAQPTAATELSPVVVTATQTERLQLDVPASVDLIEGAQVRDAQLRINLSESLVRVPGIVVLDRQNYAQDLQISIRGFGSRSSFGVRGVRLYVDGVPATMPDGQGQVSHFPLNLAERIEVLRGPFSALYGNASGGVIALSTELKPQAARVSASSAAGSNGTWRAGLTATGGTAPYAFTVDANRFKTEGARDHSAAQRDSFNLRVAALDSPVGRIRLSLNALEMPDAQDPLGLTRAQWAKDPNQASPAALQFNTRKASRQKTLGAEIQSALTANTTLTTAMWVGTRAVTQFQAIPVAAQIAPTSPGGVIDLDRSFGGGDLRLGYASGPLTLTLGLTAEQLDENRRGYNNFIATGAGSASSSTSSTVLGVQGALRRDETNRIDSLGPYLQAEYVLGPQWRMHAGVRSTEVKFKSTDRYVVGSNRDDSGAVSYSGVTPSAGIVYRPTTATSLYASYGRGFETPTLNELAYRPDGSAGFNNTLRPARSDNAEIGAKAVWSTLRANVAAFAVRTEDDIVVQTNVGGRSAITNAARTRREGIEASMEWTPTARLSLTVSAAVLNARFDTAFLTCGPAPCTTPTLPVAQGNRLPGVPEKTLYTQLRYRLGHTDLTADWRLQSALAVDDRNTDKAPGYGVVSLAAARTLDVAGRKPRLLVRVDNLFDQRYSGSVIVNEGNGRYFEPAPGRTWLLGIDWPM